MSDIELESGAEAPALLAEMRHDAGTLFRALDTDGDGVLSAEEIAEAPSVLRALDRDGDGYLREQDLGGPTLINFMIRRSGIVRLLDPDGDLVIGPDDIADASARILRLDADGDGRVSEDDDLPDLSKNAENNMPMGGPAERLAYQRKMFSRRPGMSGPLPPAGRPDVQPGYLLIQEVSDRGDVQKSHKTVLMDEHGALVHTWPTPQRLPEATVTYLLDDGNLLRTTCEHDWLVMDGRFPIGANGTLNIMAPDGTVLWAWTHLEFGAEALHHDVEMLPNGNILAISWHIVDAATARAHGWVQQGARDFIVLDKVYEVKPNLASGAADVIWEWRMLDHVVQDGDPDAPGFGDPATCSGKIDINWPQLDRVQFNSGQLLHTNSVSYNADEDVILLSSAIFGEIWVIDHSTTIEEARGSTGGRRGRGGDLIWRWGNPQTHRAGGPDDQVLYWQHDAHFLSNGVPRAGEVLVFNNGMRRGADGTADPEQICMGMLSGAYSSIVEITLPRDADGRLACGQPPRVDWRFNADGDLAFYSPFMGNAQRLPNGNTLTVQACDKRIVEVTPEGRVVMDFHVGGPGRMYRVYKYAPDHPGIRALGLQGLPPLAPS